MADAVAHDSILVLRDGDRQALPHPESRTFRGFGPVTYVHTADSRVLPPASHYVFHVDSFTEDSRAWAASAIERGARVTAIVRAIDEATAEWVGGTTLNVLPAYGDLEHIGRGTLRRALRMACGGARVIARGFLENSSDAFQPGGARPTSTFLSLVERMSEEARRGESVVAAVLAPHRTGSQFLRDLIGWTAGAGVRICHEHFVPAATDVPIPNGPLIDVLASEPNPVQQRAIRRGALSRLLRASTLRYIFVSYRDPVDRVISYFVKRHSALLRQFLDDATQRYREPDEIQREFDQWLAHHVRSHSRWFRTTLFDHFGLDVCRATSTQDGLLVERHGANTLVVVPTEGLNGLRDEVEARYGAATCAPLVDDSAFSRGDGPITAAFRQQIHVPDAVARALRGIRESAYIRAHTGSVVRR